MTILVTHLQLFSIWQLANGFFHHIKSCFTYFFFLLRAWMFLTAELEHLGDFSFTEGLLLRNIKLNSKLNENEENYGKILKIQECTSV